MLEKIKELLGPFYSASFYSRLATQGKGVGLSFIALVVLITIAGAGAMTFGSLQDFMREQHSLFEKLPDVAVRNGALATIPPEPLTLTIFEEAEEGPLVIQFDTQATPMEADTLLKKMEAEGILIYVASNGITVRGKATGESQFHGIDKEADKTVTHEDWMRISGLVASLFLPTTLIALFISLFIMHSALVIAGALILLIIEPLFKINMTFAPLMRIAAAAKVPVAVFFCLLPPHLPMQALIWFGFAIFGLLAYKKAAADHTAP